MRDLNKAPGIDYEHVDARATMLNALRTDIAAFVGIAERGPLHRPVPIDSWKQFLGHFGNFTGKGYLAYAVRAFFENGGERCWVTRVSHNEAASKAEVVLNDAHGSPVLRFTAATPGAWGNRLRVTVREKHPHQTQRTQIDSFGHILSVGSVTGFEVGTLAKLSQPGHPPKWRVVYQVDSIRNRLLWDDLDYANKSPYYQGSTSLDTRLPVLVESVSYQIDVYEDSNHLRRYNDLSLVPGHRNYAPSVLAPYHYPDPCDITEGIMAPPEPIAVEELRTLIQPDHADGLLRKLTSAGSIPATFQTFALAHGVDGISQITVEDYIGEPFSECDSDFIQERKNRGIRRLERIPEISLLAVPDIHIQPELPLPKTPPSRCTEQPCLRQDPKTLRAGKRSPEKPELPQAFADEEIIKIQLAAIEHCETQTDRVVLLDPPYRIVAEPARGLEIVQSWRQAFESSYAATYFAWCEVLDPLELGGERTRIIPPSGHMAGSIASVDLEIGVHKAPANHLLNWIQNTSYPIDSLTHALLNRHALNALIPQIGKGIRVLGARTLSRDRTLKYLNIRRLLIFLRKALIASSEWAVFEPNNALTRSKIFLTFTSFLLALWQNGGLVGETADAAFRVKCDDENNPPRLQDLGQLIAEVWVAPVHPYEFILIRVGRNENSLEIEEISLATRNAA